jgi:hypothetical protein
VIVTGSKDQGIKQIEGRKNERNGVTGKTNNCSGRENYHNNGDQAFKRQFTQAKSNEDAGKAKEISEKDEVF